MREIIKREHVERKTFAKTYDELTFTDDFMFCKVLENDEDLCKQMIETILGKEIEIVEGPDKQKTIEVMPDKRGIRMDIRIVGEDGAVYTLEMQNGHKEELPRRARYYQGLTDIDFLERGAKYKDLPKTFIIFICTFDPFGLGQGMYTVKQKIEEEADFDYNDGTTKIFLSSPSGRRGELSEELTDLLNYVNGSRPDGALSRNLDEAVERTRSQSTWRKEFMFLGELFDEVDKEALEVGRAEGLEQGLEQGLKEGLKEGLKQGRVETAKKLKAAGVPIATIVECTGLSEEEVESL